MFLCRDRWGDYAEQVFAGMANKIAAVTIVAWFWAGMFAQVLRVGGLVDGLVWLGAASHATGGIFVGATFLLASTFASAAWDAAPSRWWPSSPAPTRTSGRTLFPMSASRITSRVR